MKFQNEIRDPFWWWWALILLIIGLILSGWWLIITDLADTIRETGLKGIFESIWYGNSK